MPVQVRICQEVAMLLSVCLNDCAKHASSHKYNLHLLYNVAQKNQVVIENIDICIKPAVRMDCSAN